MNDEFLYRLRTQPPARLAASLKARLEFQAAVLAAKRRARKWYVFFGILLGAVAVASVTPRVRSAMSPWFGVASERDTASAPAREAGTNPRRALDVGSGAVDDGGSSAQSSTAEPARTPAVRGDIGARTTPSDASPHASTPGAAARQRLRVYAVVSADVPQEVMGTIVESFQEAYGYSVERKLVSADEPACVRYNDVDVIVTVGRLSDANRTSCEQRGVRFMEVPIAHEAYVAVVHRENTWVDALTIADIRMLERSPYDTLTTWNQLRPSWPSLPLTLFGVDSTHRTLGEGFVPSRAASGIPLAIRKDDAGVPNAVSATYGGLGFMSLASYQSQSEAASRQLSVVPVKLLGIVNQKGDTVMPSLETVQDGSYDTLSRSLLIHFNVRHLYRQEVLLFGTHTVEGTSPRLSEHGLIPLDELSRDVAARKIRAGGRGR